jgi:hypothetical protein
VSSLALPLRRSFGAEAVRKNRVLIIRRMNRKIASSPEQLLSRRAVAARWQTSTETIKRREKEGLLKAIPFNQRLLRYKLSDIEALEAAAGGSAK